MNAPQRLTASLHPGQQRAQDSTAKVIMVIAGTGGGKTAYSPLWALTERGKLAERGIMASSGIVVAPYKIPRRTTMPSFLRLFQHKLQLGDWESRQDGIWKFHDHVGGGYVYFCSADTPESLEGAHVHWCIMDECLAPESIIQTEIGPLPISIIVNLRISLRIWSYDKDRSVWELMPIRRWIRLPQRKPLLNIGSLRLTGNHPVWTRDGYREAEDLTVAVSSSIMKAEIVNYEEHVRRMRYATDPAGAEALLQYQMRSECAGTGSVVQTEALEGVNATFQGSQESQAGLEAAAGSLFGSLEAPLEVLRNASAEAVRAQVAFENHEERSALDAGRQRTASELATGEASASLRLAERVCGEDRAGLATACLQDRHSESQIEDRYRSWESCQSAQTEMVQAEWVDVSTLLEQNGGGVDGGLSSDGYVYNLEVEKNHNYIAEKILVANCGQRQFPEESFRAAERRVRFHEGRILGTTTPYVLGWLKELSDAAKLPPEDPESRQDVEIITFPSTENPKFPKVEFERARSTLPPWMFRMFYQGEWDRPAGLVYSMLADEHWVNFSALPDSWKEWPGYVGVDFGYNNPHVNLYGTLSPDDVLYVFDEYYEMERTNAKNAQEAPHRQKIKMGWADPAAPEAIAEFVHQHWPLTAAPRHAVLDGLKEVFERLATGRLFFIRGGRLSETSLSETSKELDSYVWDADKADQVIKLHDHCMDALRYLCWGLKNSGHTLPDQSVTPGRMGAWSRPSPIEAEPMPAGYTALSIGGLRRTGSRLAGLPRRYTDRR